MHNSITSLPLPRRAINALQRGGIATLEDAAQWRDQDLLTLPQFGPAAMARLRALIAQENIMKKTREEEHAHEC